MKILLANPRGFCAGVNYAIDIVNETYDLYHGKYNIYILNEIVHNKTIVEDYQSRGIKSVTSIEDIPISTGDTANSILIFSAHGVPPEYHDIAKQRGIMTIDATCPLVRKVHLEALKFAQEGYEILYIGHRGHEEAVGVMAECPDSITLIEDIEEAKTIMPNSNKPLAYLTQTTLSVDETIKIIEILESRFEGIISPKKEDICLPCSHSGFIS